MELGGRINAEDAYQMIKDEMKEVKACRKKFNKNNGTLKSMSHLMVARQCMFVRWVVMNHVVRSTLIS